MVPPWRFIQQEETFAERCSIGIVAVGFGLHTNAKKIKNRVMRGQCFPNCVSKTKHLNQWSDFCKCCTCDMGTYPGMLLPDSYSALKCWARYTPLLVSAKENEIPLFYLTDILGRIKICVAQTVRACSLFFFPALTPSPNTKNIT